MPASRPLPPSPPVLRITTPPLSPTVRPPPSEHRFPPCRNSERTWRPALLPFFAFRTPSTKNAPPRFALLTLGAFFPRHTEKLRFPVMSHGFPLSSRIVPRVASPFCVPPVAPGGILTVPRYAFPLFDGIGCRFRGAFVRGISPVATAPPVRRTGRARSPPPLPFFRAFPPAPFPRRLCPAPLPRAMSVRRMFGTLLLRFALLFSAFPPNIPQEYALHAKAGEFFAKYRILPPQTAKNTQFSTYIRGISTRIPGFPHGFPQREPKNLLQIKCGI